MTQAEEGLVILELGELEGGLGKEQGEEEQVEAQLQLFLLLMKAEQWEVTHQR